MSKAATQRVAGGGQFFNVDPYDETASEAQLVDRRGPATAGGGFAACAAVRSSPTLDRMEATAWSEIVAALDAPGVEACVEAASRLHAEAGVDDIPRLLGLLKSGDFFVREAAAWPLAELAGPAVLADLLVAYQRGFDEGHDNDGFTAALLEIPALFPEEAKASLASIIATAAEPTRGHALWLLEFCQGEARQ